MVQWEPSGRQSVNYGFLEAGMHFRFALLTSSLRATTVCTTSPTSPAVGKLQEDRTGVCHRCSLCTAFQSKWKSSGEEYQLLICIPWNYLTRSGLKLISLFCSSCPPENKNLNYPPDLSSNCHKLLLEVLTTSVSATPYDRTEQPLSPTEHRD